MLALVGVALLVLYGLVISPADVEMGDNVRLMYVHVPSATYLYVGCFITTVASGLWLWKRTPGWDALAEAGAEVGLAVRRHHAAHRLAVGPPDVGHLLDVGRPAHLHRRADRPARRLPGAAPPRPRPRRPLDPGRGAGPAAGAQRGRS